MVLNGGAVDCGLGVLGPVAVRVFVSTAKLGRKRHANLKKQKNVGLYNAKFLVLKVIKSAKKWVLPTKANTSGGAVNTLYYSELQKWHVFLQYQPHNYT